MAIGDVTGNHAFTGKITLFPRTGNRGSELVASVSQLEAHSSQLAAIADCHSQVAALYSHVAAQHSALRSRLYARSCLLAAHSWQVSSHILALTSRSTRGVYMPISTAELAALDSVVVAFEKRIKRLASSRVSKRASW